MSLNFILHGECNVGKTSLRNRWVDGIFTGDVAPTFGVDFNIKTLDLVQDVEEEGENEVDEAGGSSGADESHQPGTGGEAGGRSTKPAPCADLLVKINVYDTSGKPGYRDVNSTYLLAFDAVLFVYDISSMPSLHVSHTDYSGVYVAAVNNVFVWSRYGGRSVVVMDPHEFGRLQ